MKMLDHFAAMIRLPDGRPTAAIEAEIREELEFHLAMSTQHQELAGQSPTEAREYALTRFGDFDAVEAECRRVQLGERTALQRIQVAAMVGMLAGLAWIAFVAHQSQQRHDAALGQLNRELAQLQSNLSLIVDRAPPVVIETHPSLGAVGVDPSETEIRVTFSKEMLDRSWSWCQTEHPFPESTGPIHYLDDRRTCVMPVKLKPDTEYVVSINSQRFDNFKDPSGRSAEPYFLCFTTAPSH